MHCPLCTHASSETLAVLPASITSESKPLEGQSELKLCPQCGHVFTWAAVDWDTYYSQQYDATLTDDGLDELVVGPDGKTQFRTDFDYGLFRRMTGDALHGAARVLEFGCGRGRILSRLKKDGFRRVWACDVSEKYRPRAAELLGAANVSIGSIPRGPFQVICTFFVLEHDVDPLASLSALRERLSDDGTLFLMVPSWRTNLGDLACADHVHHFSIESLHMLCAAAGLGVTGVDLSAAGTIALTAKRAAVAGGFDNERLAEANRLATKPFLETLARLNELPQRLAPARRVFLYGAGFYAALASTFVPKVSGIYDANPRKQGLERLGHTVAAPSRITPHAHRDDTLLVCINSQSAGAIAEQYRHAFGDVVTLSQT
jgi:SAM-dependent methyltransferase